VRTGIEFKPNTLLGHQVFFNKEKCPVLSLVRTGKLDFQPLCEKSDNRWDSVWESAWKLSQFSSNSQRTTQPCSILPHPQTHIVPHPTKRGPWATSGSFFVCSIHFPLQDKTWHPCKIPDRIFASIENQIVGESIELEKCSIELWIGLGTNLRPIVGDLVVLSRLCFLELKM
jgi:hypothetical protein